MEAYSEITQEGYVEVNTTQSMRERAFKNAKRFLDENKEFSEHIKRTSVVPMSEKLDAIRAGYIAEEACLAVFPELDASQSCDDFDFLYSKRSWECKSLRCKFKPPMKYEMSITDFSGHQKTDFYILARVLNEEKNFAKTWIVGFITKSEFLLRSWFQADGSVRESDGYVYKGDCQNILMQDIPHRPFTKEKVDEVLNPPKITGRFF